MMGKHKFKAGDKVVCTWGTNKGKAFTIRKRLSHDGYSCTVTGEADGRYYYMNDRTVKKADDNA